MTKEIPSQSWQNFCKELSAMPQAMVTIQVTDSDGRIRIVAENVPLVGLTFQKQEDSCNDLLTIETALSGERTTQHPIIEPIRLVLRKADANGRFDRLEILHENGTTQITFRPGINSVY